MTKKGLLIGLFACLLWTQTLAQDKQYISDQLEAPVRAGAGDSYRITKMLPSGYEVDVLSENKSTNYVQIRYGNAQGWIHKRFVMNEPAARTYVQAAKEQFGPLQKEIDGYKASIIQKDERLQDLEEENNKLKQALQFQAEQLAYIEKASENVMRIDTENKELQEKSAQQSLIIDSLEKQNRSLVENKRSDEWITGAALIFFGLLFGALILPRLLRFRTHKKSWDHF